MIKAKNVTKHLILLALLSQAQAFAQNESAKIFTEGLSSTLKTAGFKNVGLELGADYGALDSRTDKGSVYQTKMNLELEAEVVENIDFNFSGGFSYQSGNSSSQEAERVKTYKPKFTYDYGYFDFRPLSFVKISAGALDNSTKRQYISPFINGGTSFIGAREVIATKVGNFYLRLQATQAKPQNAILRETFNIDDSGDPQFFSESADISYLTKALRIGGAVGSYRYKKLSGDLANKDYYWGNSVSIGTPIDQSLYLYDFTGIFANAGIEITLGDNSLKLSGSYIKNTESVVPDDKNTGYSYRADFKTNMGDKKITLSALAFENQADTAPAFYRGGIFSNDYKGYAVGFELETQKGFSTEFNYINRTVLGNLDSAYLIDGYSDEQVYTISLRKEYDIL
ncbi:MULTISPECIES: hypothetical protein [unclassified Halobacteriovorax]|uniref:hypothetical protein n=1 Tax=unclassified Halobacteriovorax TaxID=2639665 RepID=UPI00399AD752